MSFEAADRVDLPLRVGPRTVARLRRKLVRRATPLVEALGHPTARLPALPRDAHGFLLFGVPEASISRLAAGTGLRPFVRQRYARRYAALDTSFDEYLSAAFTGKARSTLRRKLRKFEQEAGSIDVRCYSRPDQAAEFCRHARTVSALTYQERLLEAGLPEEAQEEMEALAEADSVRGWLLFLGEKPISYLYAPADEETLIYAYLGYDPAYAHLSPGTILQHEAMRMLMKEGRFRWFDFTEGDGQHKRQFATGAIDSVDLLLLRPTAANLLTAHLLAGFDASVAALKRTLRSIAGERLLRAVRR